MPVRLRLDIGGLATNCVLHDGPANAPWLVFIHCLGGSLELWSRQVAPLSRSFRLVTYDLRGQGKSAVPDSEYSISSLADDAGRLMDSLSIDRATFVGLSLGGLVAQTVAAEHAERVDKLVLAHTTTHFDAAGASSLQERAARAEAGELRQIADEAMTRTLTDRFRGTHPAEVARLHTIFEETSPKGFALACHAMSGFDGRAALSRIGAPTLVIAGASDPISPPELSRALAGAIADSRLVCVPRAAHLSCVERPAIFNRIVREVAGLG